MSGEGAGAYDRIQRRVERVDTVVDEDVLLMKVFAGVHTFFLSFFLSFFWGGGIQFAVPFAVKGSAPASSPACCVHGGSRCLLFPGFVSLPAPLVM